MVQPLKHINVGLIRLMKKTFILVFGLLLLGTSSCSTTDFSSQPALARNKILALKQNHKYKYTCIFYGDDIQIGDHVEPVFIT